MMERKKTLNVFKDAREAFGSYDDFPVGQPGVDPMPHLSRNRCAQPFFLVSEADQVIVQMAGKGEIEFADVEPRVMTLEPGDTVYIPACLPSRLVPHGENVQIRLKAEPGVREIVAWYCRYCRVPVWSVDIPAGIVQQAYWDAVHAFNSAPRACPMCGKFHEPAELGDIAWPRVAEVLK